ncbi:hypothetical protein DFJ67_6547 [Asanoa ferruginea]|uniref:DUF6883 domain-containing protein n=1 Tax=Asanoa ferruginea TaxID=53367 RepID=A0A3D9ZVE0_9ACTN|nr:DUF6883 domain-containing protein [Asanoa ferruginea]REG00493.1 hypothetical protein DFJ67_6547 [Asanoa ferruginea]GIF47654.1 hypothetical protein Afe04nite_21930 [Asanoa ferruginea]
MAGRRGGQGGRLIRAALRYLRKAEKRAGHHSRATAPPRSARVPGAPPETVRKFSDYIFKPGATHGKDKVFRSYGYDREHSEQLATEFTRQGNARYAAGEFTLGRADQHGQRITIPVDLVGRGDAAGRSTTVKTGWMIRPDGSITLNTPFTGFAR